MDAPVASSVHVLVYSQHRRATNKQFTYKVLLLAGGKGSGYSKIHLYSGLNQRPGRLKLSTSPLKGRLLDWGSLERRSFSESTAYAHASNTVQHVSFDILTKGMATLQGSVEGLGTKTRNKPARAVAEMSAKQIQASMQVLPPAL
jgi:hypothetical protein